MFLPKNRASYTVWQHDLLSHDKPGKDGQGLILNFAQQHSSSSTPICKYLPWSRAMYQVLTSPQTRMSLILWGNTKSWMQMHASISAFLSRNSLAPLCHSPETLEQDLKNEKQCQHLLEKLCEHYYPTFISPLIYISKIIFTCRHMLGWYMSGTLYSSVQAIWF